MAEVRHFDIDGTVIDLPAQTAVNNATLTIQKNGTTVQTFTANASANKTANITVPTKTSELTNDSGFITNAGVTGVKGNSETSYRTGQVNITKANIGLGSVENFKAVSTVASQGLSDTEKSNARANIGAGTSSFSGSYNDLTNKPTIPTVNNATLTIQKNGTNVQTFTANASANKTANITVPTKTSELTNDSGYTTNTGTVTQVKVGSTAYNPSSGVVSLPAYPTVNNATLTIQKNGTNVQTFTANASANKTANITVPVTTILEVQPTTVSCSNQVWKRLGLITLPANCKATVSATVSHSLANIGCKLSLGTVDASENACETTIPEDARTFDYHYGNCTTIINNTSSSTQNVYANVWLTGGSGNVNLKEFRALIIT